VLRRARQILGNEDDAAEILQELFVGRLELDCLPFPIARMSSARGFCEGASAHRPRACEDRTKANSRSALGTSFLFCAEPGAMSPNGSGRILCVGA
jgi:hypothetical protein